VLIGLVAAAWVNEPSWRNREAPQRPSASKIPTGAPFSLIDPAGQSITDQDFRGKFMLIYFGYTTCPHHCSTMLMVTADALKSLGPRADQVQPIFITVDPEHDTPDVMGRYTIQFSPRLLGLTGSPAQVDAAEKAYGVQALFRRTEPQPGAYPYVIDHSSAFYLVAPDGQLIAELESEGDADELAGRIQRHLHP
jgi:protein SCO1/2